MTAGATSRRDKLWQASLSVGADAHAQVDAFEQRVVAGIPELTDVVSHIEPRAEVVAGGTDVTSHALNLTRMIEQIAATTPPLLGWHDLQVQEVGRSYPISLYCLFPGDCTLEQVHVAMETMERQLRSEISVLGRILIHPEPMTE